MSKCRVSRASQALASPAWTSSAGGAERLAVGRECAGERRLAFDRDRERGAARNRLERQRAGSRVQVEAAPAGKILAEPVEQRLANAVGRRPQPRRRRGNGGRGPRIEPPMIRTRLAVGAAGIGRAGGGKGRLAGQELGQAAGQPGTTTGPVPTVTCRRRRRIGPVPVDRQGKIIGAAWPGLADEGGMARCALPAASSIPPGLVRFPCSICSSPSPTPTSASRGASGSPTAWAARARSSPGALASAFSRRTLDDETLEALETALLTADVGVAATQHLLDDLKAALEEGRRRTRIREPCSRRRWPTCSRRWNGRWPFPTRARS